VLICKCKWEQKRLKATALIFIVNYCNREAYTQASTMEAIVLMFVCLIVVNGKVFQLKNTLYIYLIKLLSEQIEIVLEHSKEIADLQAGANIHQKRTDLQADVRL